MLEHFERVLIDQRILCIPRAIVNIVGMESAPLLQLDGRNRNVQSRTKTLAVCLTLGTLTSATAVAPPLEPPFNSYAAKFTCGVLKADADDVKGTYATAINIHNPQATDAVQFLKKIVVANQEEKGFGSPFISQDNLPP